MTLRIERFRAKHGTRIRLSGELRFEQLGDVRTEMKRGGLQVTLDLEEVVHVDIAAVRFLNACEARNVEIVNCAHYIREWMSLEHKQTQSKEELAEDTFQ